MVSKLWTDADHLCRGRPRFLLQTQLIGLPTLSHTRNWTGVFKGILCTFWYSRTWRSHNMEEKRIWNVRAKTSSLLIRNTNDGGILAIRRKHLHWELSILLLSTFSIHRDSKEYKNLDATHALKISILRCWLIDERNHRTSQTRSANGFGEL